MKFKSLIAQFRKLPNIIAVQETWFPHIKIKYITSLNIVPLIVIDVTAMGELSLISEKIYNMSLSIGKANNILKLFKYFCKTSKYMENHLESVHFTFICTFTFVI